ncbi:hypothetical protein Hanom_Chr16g01438061 [Helianthus anomalus]
MGYVGDFRQKEIKRNGLTRDWRVILHVNAISIAHRKGGYDVLNLEWSGAMLNLCLKQKFNFSGLIFNYMIENSRGNTWEMYPRFIQMLINDQYSDLPHEGGRHTFMFPLVVSLPSSKQTSGLCCTTGCTLRKDFPWLKLHIKSIGKHSKQNNREMCKQKKKLNKKKKKN